jgi:hypothetical protein
MTARRLLLLVAVVGALMAAFYGVRYYRASEQMWIEGQLDAISETGNPDSRASSVDYFCFNNSNGTERDDFLRAAKRAGADIGNSIEKCGVDGTCCDLSSDLAGTIGVIRNNEIRCLPITRFAYILEGDNLCAQPDNLVVSKERFSSDTRLRGRPWVGKMGDRYYRIRERAR